MASKTPSPAGLSPPQRFPLQVVSGWRLIREVEIPAQDGKLPHFGEAVAFVRDTSTAYQMAAAPAMLAALKALVPADFAEHPQDFHGDWHAARAAIAKAEGRS